MISALTQQQSFTNCKRRRESLKLKVKERVTGESIILDFLGSEEEFDRIRFPVSSSLIDRACKSNLPSN